MTNSATTSVKSFAVTTTKVITYPAHLVFQTLADLINSGQAVIINLIDGTAVEKSTEALTSWTQLQHNKVLYKAMELKFKWDNQRESNRQQDIAKAKAHLDKLEGVERVEEIEEETTATPTMTVPAPPPAV